MSESYALSLFLWGIKNPDFEMILEIQNNKDDNNPMQYVINIRKQERESSRRKVPQRGNSGIK